MTQDYDNAYRKNWAVKILYETVYVDHDTQTWQHVIMKANALCGEMVDRERLGHDDESIDHILVLLKQYTTYLHHELLTHTPASHDMFNENASSSWNPVWMRHIEGLDYSVNSLLKRNSPTLAWKGSVLDEKFQDLNEEYDRVGYMLIGATNDVDQQWLQDGPDYTRDYQSMIDNGYYKDHLVAEFNKLKEAQQ